MRIAVIGAGLSGCTMAHVLSRRHAVTVFEQRPLLGGLCATQKSNDLLFNLYGGHCFHTNDDAIWAFVRSVADWRTHIQQVAVNVNGTMVPFPPTKRESAMASQYAVEGLAADAGPFEIRCREKFGDWYFETCIRDYSRHVWNCPVSAIPAWVADRLKPRREDGSYFPEDRWSAMPVQGYSAFCEALLADSMAFTGVVATPDMDADFDFVVDSSPLSLNLTYQKIAFEATRLPMWPWPYDLVNEAKPAGYARRFNYSIQYGQTDGGEAIYGFCTYNSPSGIACYPKPWLSPEGAVRHKLANSLEAYPKRMKVGRLGLYQYMDMDDAIRMALSLSEHADEWAGLSVERKLEIYAKEGIRL